MFRLPNAQAVPRRLDGGDESSIDAMARFLLDAVDGRSSISALGDSCGIGEDLARRMVADLARRGVLSVPGCEGLREEGPTPAARDSGGAADRVPQGDDLTAEIERYYGALGRWNYYELLGIAPDADRKQARGAYFSLSKKFHPDRAFGKRAAGLRKKMEVIFRRLTQAYDVISSAEQRAEYNNYIADQIAVWKMERQLLEAVEAGREPAADPPAPEPPAAPGPEIAPEPPPPGRSAAAPAPRRPDGVSSAPPAARPEHDSRRRAWQRERAGRMLRQTLGPPAGGPPAGSATPPAGPETAEELLARGEIARETGNHAEAVRLFAEATSRAPDDERIAKLLERAKADAARALASGYLRQGRYERLQGDCERARANLEKAVEIDRGNIEARYQLAELLFFTRQDLRRALALARETIALGGQKARYFAILGELLLLAKETEGARESFARAAGMEPDNKEYRRRLKACKG